MTKIYKWQLTSANSGCVHSYAHWQPSKDKALWNTGVKNKELIVRGRQKMPTRWVAGVVSNLSGQKSLEGAMVNMQIPAPHPRHSVLSGVGSAKSSGDLTTLPRRFWCRWFIAQTFRILTYGLAGKVEKPTINFLLILDPQICLQQFAKAVFTGCEEVGHAREEEIHGCNVVPTCVRPSWVFSVLVIGDLS
jgi:hypothetical protein